MARRTRCDRLGRQAAAQSDLFWAGLAARGPLTEERAEQADTRERVAAALSALPPQQGRAVVLAAVYGYTASEVSSLEGVPLGTAKTRIPPGPAKIAGNGIRPGRRSRRTTSDDHRPGGAVSDHTPGGDMAASPAPGPEGGLSPACAAVDADLAELALGALTGKDRVAALAHLEVCHRCAGEVEQLAAAADGFAPGPGVGAARGL